MTRSSSILARILGLHAAVLLFTAIVVAGAVYLFLDSTAERLQRQTLLAHAESLQQGLSSDGRQLSPQALAAIAASGESFSWMVLDGEGQRLIASANMVQTTVPQKESTQWFRERSRSAVLSAISLPASLPAGPVWIVVIQNLEHPDVIFDDILRQFLLWGALPIGLLLLMLLLVDAAIVRRALQPVKDASQQVGALDVDDLGVRLPVAGMPSEVLPLALAVNAALDRVAAGYHIQRDFIADAAHELRTPIAIARMRVATMDGPETAGLRNDLLAMGRIIDQLLDIAAAENMPAQTAQTMDLVAVAAQAVETTAPLAIASGHIIALKAPPALVVCGSAELTARALDALLENALHHTPPGTQIEVEVTRDARLVVRDNGPGIGPADQQNMFQRFWRGDRSLPNHSGLGLAIAERIAHAHHSRILYTQTPGGGATFALQFRQ